MVLPVPASRLPVENNGTVPAIMDAGGIAVLSDGGDVVPAMRGGGGLSHTEVVWWAYMWCAYCPLLPEI